MDPISYAAFVFVLGWVASHAFGEKRDEYEHSQDAHREKYMRKLADKHPSWSKARQARYLQNAARRNALGHFAYLLRHGWSSTFNDFAHGWDKAKAAHEEWKAEHPKDDKKPSWWATFKAGIQKERATRYVEKAKAEPAQPKQAPTPAVTPPPVPAPTPAADDETETDPWLTDDEARDAQIFPWPAGKPAPANQTPGDNAGQTNGSTTVEYNLDATKAGISEIGQYATSKMSMIEQIVADAMAGGMSADQEAMGLLASLNEALRNVAAYASAFVDSVNKHASGQEYANSGHAANTDYLKSS